MEEVSKKLANFVIETDDTGKICSSEFVKVFLSKRLVTSVNIFVENSSLATESEIDGETDQESTDSIVDK